eukprot:4052338-Alexandrium_andersonii.AAC.1
MRLPGLLIGASSWASPWASWFIYSWASSWVSGRAGLGRKGNCSTPLQASWSAALHLLYNQCWPTLATHPA